MYRGAWVMTSVDTGFDTSNIAPKAIKRVPCGNDDRANLNTIETSTFDQYES